MVAPWQTIMYGVSPFSVSYAPDVLYGGDCGEGELCAQHHPQDPPRQPPQDWGTATIMQVQR